MHPNAKETKSILLVQRSSRSTFPGCSRKGPQERKVLAFNFDPLLLSEHFSCHRMGLESTTQVVGEPALSFVYDGAFKRSLYEQFVKAAGGKDGEGELERVVRGLEEGDASGFNGNREGNAHAEAGMSSDADNDPSGDESASSSDVEGLNNRNQRGVGAPAADNPNSPFFNMFSLFEGSPTYKQRRKKPSRPSALSSAAMASTTSAQHGIVTEGIASNGDIVRGRYDIRTINGTPNSSVSSVNRYSYPPSGEQYALYPTGSTYSHDTRPNIGYHPGSSPPNTTQYPILHNSYGLDIGYGQGEYSSNVPIDTAGVRVKQESISAADMFLMQARGGLPNVPFVESRATKRHSYAGSSRCFLRYLHTDTDTLSNRYGYRHYPCLAGRKIYRDRHGCLNVHTSSTFRKPRQKHGSFHVRLIALYTSTTDIFCC